MLDKNTLNHLKHKFGFSDGHIADLSKEEINRYLTLEQVHVAKQEKYFKLQNVSSSGTPGQNESPEDRIITEVTEEEAKQELANSSSGPDGVITTKAYDPGPSTSWIKLETWLIQYGEIAEASARFEWLKVPTYKDQDVFAIGTSSNLVILTDTESFTLKYDEFKFTRTYDFYGQPIYGWVPVEVNKTRADRRDAGGYGYVFDIVDANPIRSLRGYMKFSTTHRNPKWGGEFYDAFSHYAHQETVFVVEPSFGLPLGGALALSSESKFDKVTGHVQERLA